MCQKCDKCTENDCNIKCDPRKQKRGSHYVIGLGTCSLVQLFIKALKYNFNFIPIQRLVMFFSFSKQYKINPNVFCVL